MSKSAFVGAIVVALVSVPAFASQKLASQRGCMECHAKGKEVWGPSFHDIATLYKGTQGAQQKVQAKILMGGAEHWGNRQMPPHAPPFIPVTDAEAAQLAAWVLKQ
jgi:cytochrome c551/c552